MNNEKFHSKQDEYIHYVSLIAKTVDQANKVVEIYTDAESTLKAQNSVPLKKLLGYGYTIKMIKPDNT